MQRAEVREAHADNRHHKPAPIFTPLTGWPLEALVELDRHRPGLLSQLMTSRSRRRQAVFAALAAGAMDRPQAFASLLGQGCWHGVIWPAVLAEALLTCDPRDIVRAAYGGCPDGLLSTMGRIGPDPIDASDYPRLHAIFADPKQRRRQLFLAESATLTGRRLRAIEALPAIALHRNVLSAVRNEKDARAIGYAVNLVLKSSPGRAAVVRKMLSDCGTIRGSFGVVDKLLKQCEPTVALIDLSGCPGARHLNSQESLRDAGRQYKNCLGTAEHLWGIVSGEMAFLAFDEEGVIAQLFATGEGWVVSALHMAANAPMSAGTRLAMVARCDQVGLPVLSFLRRSSDQELAANTVNAGGWPLRDLDDGWA